MFFFYVIASMTVYSQSGTVYDPKPLKKTESDETVWQDYGMLSDVCIYLARLRKIFLNRSG